VIATASGPVFVPPPCTQNGCASNVSVIWRVLPFSRPLSNNVHGTCQLLLSSIQKRTLPQIKTVTHQPLIYKSPFGRTPTPEPLYALPPIFLFTYKTSPTDHHLWTDSSLSDHSNTRNQLVAATWVVTMIADFFVVFIDVSFFKTRGPGVRRFRQLT
jgi:hypothetical protein